eukprot:TRINITY_DN7952_c0_g1_i1.p1 TRINITY_DN7952_c0_g1~~TRINITY_DN7952_c0_g1_i1.p1  ORF type:complete len:186 (-),score=30.98 TRINITY_DN7952_c0_g1_i1:46-603(-)
MGNEMIHDITTTVDNPPKFTHLKVADYDPRVKPIQMKKYPHLKPVSYKQDPKTVYKAFLNLVEKTSYFHLAHKDDEKLSIEFVAVTKMLKFKDDVIIVVQPDGEGSLVHLRSCSRVGKSDWGANAKRIGEILRNVRLDETDKSEIIEKKSTKHSENTEEKHTEVSNKAASSSSSSAESSKSEKEE